MSKEPFTTQSIFLPYGCLEDSRARHGSLRLSRSSSKDFNEHFLIWKYRCLVLLPGTLEHIKCERICNDQAAVAAGSAWQGGMGPQVLHPMGLLIMAIAAINPSGLTTILQELLG